ncbi:hypothetical protein HUE87_11840 [Candidatus Sulfurimonas marisnigri]|uniref:Uncharacterized protein n=2 Tax=Candidatus Sulfurimonas marisnigri TaxID=2740405 RepID=A0A7S7RRP2_9BACT|nr:hypothetical protein HUE87_11840 [Candidatus Sulfurimonas marisnigri]
MKSTPHNNKRKSSPKNKTIDAAPKNEVKEMFINWFRKNNNVGQIMSKQDVVKDILTKLDSKQNDALEKAMNELKHDGLIEVKEDGVTLVLTQKGSDFI